MAYAVFSVVFGEQPSAAKWNILGSNDASFNDGTGIGAGTLTPEKLTSGTGTDWDWSSFAPSWTNITAGNGTSTGYYIQHGKTVFGFVSLLFGSTTTVDGTGVSVTAPVTPDTNFQDQYNTLGGGSLLDNGTALFGAMAMIDSTTTEINIRATDESSTGRLTELSSTSPFTWTTSDEIHFRFTYWAD